MRIPTPEELARAAEARATAALRDGGIPVVTGPRPVSGGITLGRTSTRGVETRAQEGDEGGAGRRYFRGYASATGVPYVMYDMFGPYDETVLQGAFEATLKTQPDVVLNFAHGGLPIARTNRDLFLEEDDTGLRFRAPEPDLKKRLDLVPLVDAMEQDPPLVNGASFAFRIEGAFWNSKYTKFFIEEVDLNQGDVAVVVYGANPHASSELRTVRFTAQDSPEVVEEVPPDSDEERRRGVLSLEMALSGGILLD